MKKLIILSLLLASFPSLDIYAQSVQDSAEVNPSSRPVDTVDTVDTDDKYRKVVLYEDFSWSFIDLARPQIDTAGFYKNWNENIIHTLYGLPLDSIPEAVDIRLVDDVHKFVSPVKGKVCSQFKWRKKRPHKGVDLPLQTGDSVLVAFDGVVRYVGSGKSTGGYGGLVIVRHDNGLETYYAHLSRTIVCSGETVSAGECIGLGGSTGRSTGPHLHFETRYMGKAFDPERVADFETGQLRDSVLVLKRHYFNVFSHYGQTDQQSIMAQSEAEQKAKQAKEAKAKQVYHKVRKGDNLAKIAKKYGTTVSAICKLNNISAKKALKPGQKLRVK